MTELTLAECFETLGLNNGDSFPDARRAYKTQMHRLHPDRFPNDKQAQKQAAEKFFHLKSCFSQVESYYKTFGEMPRVESEEDIAERERVSELDRREQEILRNASSLSNEPQILIGTSTPPARSRTKNSSAGEIGAGLFVIGLVAYCVLHPPTHWFSGSNSDSGSNSNAERSNYRLQQIEEAKAMARRSTVRDLLTEEQLKAKALLSKTQKALDENAQGHTFTFGSSFKDVAAIHGPPDLSEDGIWHYEESKVMFEDGQVVDWKSDPSYPLATSLR